MVITCRIFYFNDILFLQKTEMTIFSILILLIIIAISCYLMPSTKSRLTVFISLIIVTFIGYMLKGNFESFTFNEENNKIIEDIFASKEKIDELDPDRLILYLENKLNKNPKDANRIVHLKRLILELRFKNCFFHSGGICFS